MVKATVLLIEKQRSLKKNQRHQPAPECFTHRVHKAPRMPSLALNGCWSTWGLMYLWIKLPLHLLKKKKKEPKKEEKTPINKVYFKDPGGNILLRHLVTFYFALDRGNCFYDAVIRQMQLQGHPFLEGVPEVTNPRDSLRLRVQGEKFNDEEWADDPTIDTFLRRFPDCILAIVDTNHPEAGFTYYFCNHPAVGEVITYIPGAPGVLPEGRKILRIAATGNHFMSITSHPSLTNGLLKDAWSST